MKNVKLVKGLYSKIQKNEILSTLKRIEKNKSSLLLKEEEICKFKIVAFRYETIEYLFNEIFVKGDYYFKSNNKSPVIIDCGSNIGLSIIYFKYLYPNAKIIGFEPDPTTFKLLKKNIEKNKLKDVKLYNCALGNKGGNIFFYIDQKKNGSLMMSIKKDRMPEGIKLKKIKVKVRHLSSFIEFNHVDVLKIDVEGSEQYILKDLFKHNKLKNIGHIFLEYHKKKNDIYLNKLVLKFKKEGFDVKIVGPSIAPIKTSYEDVYIICKKKKND